MHKWAVPLVILCFVLLPPVTGRTASTPADSPETSRTITPEALYTAMLLDAEKGDVHVMLNLGALYEQGLGTPKNFTRALSWYEKAGTAGSADGNYRTGVCYEVGIGTVSDMSRAVGYFEKSAIAGFSQAQYKMASLYISGRGVPKNEAKGIEFLTQAARAGNGMAANELGFISLNGLLNQKKDTEKAREWFVKSAESGNLEGMKNLAVMFKDGVGKKADPAEALRWYLIAQKGGLRASDLEDVIAGLKKKLKSAQIKSAETAADKWIDAYTQKKSAENSASGK